MQQASKNEFSEFEFIQAPNFLESFDRTANLDAWDDAAAQAKENGATRLANAQQAIRNQEKIFSLSPKLAQFYGDQMKERDKRLTAQAREIQQKALAQGVELNLKEYAEYKKNESDLDGQTGYFDTKAQELHDKGQTELARQIRSLTGRRERMMHRVLLMDTANSYESDFYATRDEISIEREGEETLTWDNADTTAEKRMIMSKWREEKGLAINEIYNFSDEFLEDVYYKKVRSVDQQILNESNKDAIAIEKAEHLNNAKSIFLAAGTTNNGLLGQELISWVEANKGRYNGEAGARLAARGILLGLVEDGSLTVEQFKSMYKHGFKHNGTNKTENVGIWKEFNPEDEVVSTLLEQAEIKGLNAIELQKTAEGHKFVNEIERKLGELKRPPTEQEVRDLQNQWTEQTNGLPLPKRLVALASNTLEDRDNRDIVNEMQSNIDLGLPIGNAYERIKGDPDLYAKWQKIANSDLGKGLNPAFSAEMDDRIKAEIKEVLGMTMGVSDTTTPEYLIMEQNAKRLYAKEYRDAQFETPQEKHIWARQQTVEAIQRNGGKALKVEPSISTSQSYAKALKLGGTAIAKDPKVIYKGIIPGTEKDFKLLEQYAKDPVNSSIPYIYKVLSDNIKGMNAWELANAQYKAVNGTELPAKPTVQEKYESKSPLVKHMLTYKSSNQSVRRAAVYDRGGGNFNIEGAVLPGLSLEAVLT